MKHLTRYNEQSSYSDDDKSLDMENIQDLQDVFIALQDLGIENLNIKNIPNLRSKRYQQKYDITWTYDMNFYFDNYKQDGIYLSKGDLDESMQNLDEYRQKINGFNKIQSETVEVLERVITMGYNVLNYFMGVEKGEPLTFELSIEK